LGGLNGGFGTLGGLNLGNLGLGAVAPPVAPVSPGQIGGSSPNPQTSCPLTQKLSCRCEPLIQLPGLKPAGNPLSIFLFFPSGKLKILHRNFHANETFFFFLFSLLFDTNLI